MEQGGGSAESADAAAAFEALRREVALLNVAVGGLAAERAPAPDYSETLGEIAKGVSVAVGRLGKVMTSPAFALSPADLARQVAAAGEEARRRRPSARRGQDSGDRLCQMRWSAARKAVAGVAPSAVDRADAVDAPCGRSALGAAGSD